LFIGGSIAFAIQHRAVDAVILNLQKPFEQAFRFLAQIRTKAPKVEIIFVSPFDEETRWLWIEAIQRRAYEFLPKPLDLLELKRILLQATEKHHPMKFRKFPPAESVNGSTFKVRKSRRLVHTLPRYTYLPLRPEPTENSGVRLAPRSLSTCTRRPFVEQPSHNLL